MSKYFKTKNEFNNWIQKFKKEQMGGDCFAQFSTQLTDEDYIRGLVADGYTDLNNLIEDGHAYHIGTYKNNGWLYRDELYFSDVPEERIRDRA